MPHAVEKGTKVYVYERMGSTNKPWALANADRSGSTLNRRGRKRTGCRESYILKAITRGRGVNLNSPTLAIRWPEIIPVYPRQLCDPESRKEQPEYRRRGDVVQRFPEGSVAVSPSRQPPYFQHDGQWTYIRDGVPWRKPS